MGGRESNDTFVWLTLKRVSSSEVKTFASSRVHILMDHLYIYVSYSRFSRVWCHMPPFWRSSCVATHGNICLTLNPLTWKIWWAPNNASKWQMGFNSAFKGLRFRKCFYKFRWFLRQVHQMFYPIKITYKLSTAPDWSDARTAAAS